jgi:hypothetical protein
MDEQFLLMHISGMKLICMQPLMDPTVVETRMTLDVNILISIRYKNCIICRGE